MPDYQSLLCSGGGGADTMCPHVGCRGTPGSSCPILFHVLTGSSPDALDVLSGVLSNFLSNFTQLLRRNADSSRNRGCLGFQDALERSLHQTGLGGKSGVCRYWQEEVHGLARLLDMEADELSSSYVKPVVS